MTAETPKSFRQPWVDAEKAKRCLGEVLRQARKERNLTQDELGARLAQSGGGRKIAVSRVTIANYEGGKATPEPDVAVLLAKVLGQDPVEFLLLADLQRASQKHLDQHLADVVKSLLDKSSKRPVQSRPYPQLSGWRNLTEGVAAFTPITVVVGDKREEDPQGAGDLFVFSASTVDDRWLSSLELPHDTEKISDKVLMTAEGDRAWLKKRLGQSNILCIGSPASNLVARECNRDFLFRFAISRDTEEKWQEKFEEMRQLQSPAQLLTFRDKYRPDLKHMMRMFKPSGFVDFNYSHLKLGMDLSSGKDFAVISLGRNRFAEPGAPYFAILAAGVHHPGTAHAVRFLSDRTEFERHPFGGVLEVDVPATTCNPREVQWHNKIELSKAKWHSTGAGVNPLEYEPLKLRTRLQDWLQKLGANQPTVVDMALDKEELEDHIRLIDLLASSSSASVPGDEPTDDAEEP